MEWLDLQTTLTDIHALDENPPAPPYGRGVVWSIRGDLRHDWLEHLRREIAEVKGTQRLLHPGVYQKRAIGELLDYPTALTIWGWRHLDEAEAHAVISRAEESPGVWVAKWYAGFDQVTEWYSDCRALTEEALQRLWQHKPADIDAALDLVRPQLVARRGWPNRNHVDWYRVLEKALDDNHLAAAVAAATAMNRTGNSLFVGDLAHVPQLRPLYEGLADLLAENWETFDSVKNTAAKSLPGRLGPAIWGDDAWLRIFAGQAPQRRGKRRSVVYDLAACVDSQDVHLYLSQPGSTPPRTVIHAAADRDVEELATLRWHGRQDSSDIIWRVTANGRDIEWVWQNLPLRLVFAAAREAAIYRLHEIVSAPNSHVWNLLEDNWQGSGGALEALL